MVPQVHGHHLGRPRGDRHPWRRRLWQGGDGQGNCSNNIQNVQNVQNVQDVQNVQYVNEVHHALLCSVATGQALHLL